MPLACVRCTKVSQQTVAPGQTPPWRSPAGAAVMPSITDMRCAGAPCEAAGIWRAERPHSAQLASNVCLLGNY